MKEYKITQTIKREAIIEAEDLEDARNKLKYQPFGFAWQETEKDSIVAEVENPD